MKRIALLVALNAVGGCGLDPLSQPCPAWTQANAAGACVARAWTLPGAGDARGDAWAQNVMVAVDGHGRGLVGFSSTPGLEMLEETATDTWTLRHAGDAVGGSIPSDLVAGFDGAAVFAWSVVAGSEQVLYLSERDASGAWKEPASPADSFSFPTTAYEPRLATNQAGEWILAWNQWRSTPNYGVSVAQRESSSAPWSMPSGPDDVLSININYSNAPVIALNDAGQAIITWYQSLGGPLRAFVSERKGLGEPFSHVTMSDMLSPDGAPVDSDPVAAVKPAIFADGSAAAAWAQENGKGDTLVYLATRDAAGTWTRPRDLDDAFSMTTGYARGVQIAFGPRGDLYVVWYQDTGDGDAVYAARRRSDGTWAEDGRHPVRISSAGATGLIPKIAIGPEGGAVVVWSERAIAGAPFRVAARRTGPADQPWSEVEVLSPETGTDAVLPAIAVGPGDRAIAAWPQGPGPAQRVMIASVP
ncbi:Hypothetical protein A7982_01836 [Minicystis rosea]|nr:Hypothetical protein A7982_01836 [Minicystis rosea]